jgi:hypothetical protein
MTIRRKVITLERLDAVLKLLVHATKPQFHVHVAKLSLKLLLHRQQVGLGCKLRHDEPSRSDSRNDRKEQKSCEHDEMYDALQNRGPAGAQCDHAEKQGQRQQDLILGAQAEFERLGDHDR